MQNWGTIPVCKWTAVSHENRMQNIQRPDWLQMNFQVRQKHFSLGQNTRSFLYKNLICERLIGDIELMQ
jgi:hypothetical protein